MIEKDFGFVIKKINFRETSLIATFFTRKFGKMVGILKGFYLPKKEFTSSMDLFTLNELIFYPKPSLIWLVSFADLVKDFPFLRKDYEKNIVASKFAEIIDTVLPLGERNEHIFYLFHLALNYLHHTRPEKIFYIFFIKFLTFSGFKPEFSICLKCRRPLQKDIFFSPSRGGLLCKRCAQSFSEVERVSPDVAASILYIQNHSFSSGVRINPDGECERKIINLLDKFLSYHLNFRLLDKYSFAGRNYDLS